jgi:hypothetical protein
MVRPNLEHSTAPEDLDDVLKSQLKVCEPLLSPHLCYVANPKQATVPGYQFVKVEPAVLAGQPARQMTYKGMISGHVLMFAQVRSLALPCVFRQLVSLTLLYQVYCSTLSHHYFVAYSSDQVNFPLHWRMYLDMCEGFSITPP